jgi:16S rRNA (adenine1518-N6/adenine1519-N6)-dimethyltransferase
LENIAAHKTTLELIKKYNFRIKKNYGQNFLTDTHVLEKILRAAQVSKDDTVIEIGPGLGGMTQFLCDTAKKVYAVEIDENLCEILKETLSGFENVEIINADILKTDIPALVNGKYKVIANLPYYISTPIIMSLLESGENLESITVMVQKEVGERLRANPKTKDYGSLSVAAQYYADIYLAANVPRNSFIPRPNVDSEVIRLTPRKPLVVVKDTAFMFKIVKAAFAQRRKTLVNCLFQAEILNLSKTDLADILADIGLPETVRGEELRIFEFAQISDRLSQLIN